MNIIKLNFRHLPHRQGYTAAIRFPTISALVDHKIFWITTPVHDHIGERWKLRKDLNSDTEFLVHHVTRNGITREVLFCAKSEEELTWLLLQC